MAYALSWPKWCWFSRGHIMVWTVDQEWVRDMMLTQRLSQEHAVGKKDLQDIPHPLPSSWRGWIGCFACELSVTWALNQDLSALEPWPASITPSWELSQGGLCAPSAPTGPQREHGKSGLFTAGRSSRGLFWPRSLLAPGQPVRVPAWIYPSRVGAPDNRKCGQ